MNILSLFVLIPLLMLLGLWIARNVNQVRGVMVAGSTLLLALAAYLTVSYIGQRHAGATAEKHFSCSSRMALKCFSQTASYGMPRFTSVTR